MFSILIAVAAGCAVYFMCSAASVGTGTSIFFGIVGLIAGQYLTGFFVRKKIKKVQDELQAKYTGGTVLHMFLGEQVSDVEVIKGLIRKVATNYRLPYFTLTPTFSICPSHGYLEGEQPTFSVCRNETEIYSRVVGYLRPVKQWNGGKQAEYNDRKTFSVA